MTEANDVLTRGVVNVISDRSSLEKALTERELNVYLGIDPTATRIHLGHAVTLRKLSALAELGHKVTFLIGDFTALIGDTSDKESERPILTADEIEENFKTYKEQAEKILDFSKVEIKRNSEWLSKLAFKDIVELTQKFTLNDFIGRELIKKRLAEGKSVRLHEVLYPVMQGYDSYYMDTDLQIGGADQTFNMQAGRALQRVLRDKESFVLAVDYLPGTDGRKMSKSWGNAIWLDDNARDIYGKVMSIADALIIPYLTLATNVPLDEVEKFKDRLTNGENPINIKKELAKLITAELTSEEEAKKAEEEFEQVVQNKQMPDDIPTFEMDPDEHISITELLVKAGLAPSKSEAKRLVDGKSVEVDSDLIDSPFEEIVPVDNMIIKAGKRNYVRIKLSPN